MVTNTKDSELGNKKRGVTTKVNNESNKARKLRLRAEANVRHEEWRKLTLEAQLSDLELRPGDSVKQKQRIIRRIQIRNLYKDHGTGILEKVIKGKEVSGEPPKVHSEFTIKLTVPMSVNFDDFEGCNLAVTSTSDESQCVEVKDNTLAQHMLDFRLASVEKKSKKKSQKSD